MPLLENPILIGGILPMIFFALMDFSYRVFAGKLHFQNVFFYTAVGGTLAMTFLSLTLFEIPSHTFFTQLSNPSIIFAGCILGIIWGLTTLSMGFAYEKCNANASQVVPIASASGLFGGFLGIFALGEEVNFSVFSIAAAGILIGIIFLTTAEKNKSNHLSSFFAILLGGIVPLLSFGVLNVLFKVWVELNPGLLGVIMGITGCIIALIVQLFRKTKMVHKPQLLLTGIFWSLAVGFLGYGFGPLLGNASLLLPIVGSSPLISIFLVALFLNEKVEWWKIILGTICILFGISAINIW